jgi:ATP-dependent Clp protease ATP-binding subunit ClpX
MSSLTTTFTPPARLTYLGISAIIRRRLSHAARRSSNGSFNQGWVGSYEAGGPTEGPLNDTSNIGTPRVTPSLLKQHLDQFVVGQDRAKRTLATAVFNHYQRVQELERRDEEADERLAAEERRRVVLHPKHPLDETDDSDSKRGIAVPSVTKEWHFEDDYTAQPHATIYANAPGSEQSPTPSQHEKPAANAPLQDPTPFTIEKSNVLLLGPSGVGKTLMAKTLARVLEVPFSMSDCTPFTQAGYIGEDADVCVQRLLAAANYDVTRAERGIICLDEIDKIATARVSHGKDVSGEGVQQALLKIIEGTTLQIQAKQERGSTSASDRLRGLGPGAPGSNPLSGGGGLGQQGSGGGKGEVYNVRTDNILFICAGAFNGLHRTILDRLSKGSIGFGAQVRAAPGSSGSASHEHETMLIDEDELFEKNVPFFTAAPATPSSSSSSPSPTKSSQPSPPQRKYNTLDLVEPQDLQKFGLIPELVGRIPISCALSSLDVASLVKVLTEPRNSLVRQYMQLFALSSIELRFTTPALHAIAGKAAKMGTGARGLRTVLERLLQDAMFETPGSKTKYVLINEAVAERKSAPLYFARGNSAAFYKLIADEEAVWELQSQRDEDAGGDDAANAESSASRTFEEYRVKATAAGNA